MPVATDDTLWLHALARTIKITPIIPHDLLILRPAGD